MKRSCTVDGCPKSRKARGYCDNHWAMWKRHGTPTPTWPETCTADEGCERPVRSKKAGLCEMHYYRRRRTGTTNPQPIVYVDEEIRQQREAATRERRNERRRERRHADNPDYKPRRRLRGDCVADGCSKPMEVGENGLCRMHDLRLKKRGDLNFEFRGEVHHSWTGAEATASAIHQRVRKARGSASCWSCLDCARPAEHWSYDHLDPNEKFDPDMGPYSVDVNHYFPRCVRCHKRFDLDYLKAKRSAA